MLSSLYSTTYFEPWSSFDGGREVLIRHPIYDYRRRLAAYEQNLPTPAYDSWPWSPKLAV